MIDIFNRILAKLESFFARPHINIIKTVYVNFRLLPLKDVLKFPIFIYGNTRIISLGGSIEVHGKTTTGMLKIGRHDDNYTDKGRNVICVTSGSKIAIEGHISLGSGNIIRVADGGTLTLGDMVQTGNHVRIDCCNNILLGKLCGISYDSIISDCNHHFLIDLNTKNIARNKGIVDLGERTFIGNNCFVFKGCKTSPGSVVSAYSFVSMNYSRTPNALIMGNPATIIDENITRVWSCLREDEINTFFNNNPDKKKMKWEGNFDDPFEDVRKFYT